MRNTIINTCDHCPTIPRVYSGDEGTSMGLYSSEQRMVKSLPIFNVLGDLDELVAVIGVAKEYIDFEEGEMFTSHSILLTLEQLQKALIDVSFFLSTYRDSTRTPVDATNSLEDGIKEMESLIRGFEAKNIKKGMHLVIASGGKFSTHLYYARAVCRRFERTLMKYLIDMDGPMYLARDHIPSILTFVNRLGDFLFVTARGLADESEIYYNP